MESFSMNTAKSFLGKNVNLHMKDGSVIITFNWQKSTKTSSGEKTSLNAFLMVTEILSEYHSRALLGLNHWISI